MRLIFATVAIKWSLDRLYSQNFSDEVWVNGGPNNRRYVTVLVDVDKEEISHSGYRPECMTRRYGKLPAWIFYGVICNGKKAYGTFWEKNYGSTNSEKYNDHILSKAQELFNPNGQMENGSFLCTTMLNTINSSRLQITCLLVKYPFYPSLYTYQTWTWLNMYGIKWNHISKDIII